MNLKKLEISGFKSFVSTLEMNFSKGITAVIGPNGCGKTNIVDAIRWVLGEQKTRLLRNTKMENVIFNGTKLRKPLGMAEVHLTLSNEDRALPIDYSEVTVARRLFRNGASEYYLNGELERLKTIRGILFDTGLGNHAYSIIEREMVDSVISEKEQDKRYLFEEAAGIMRYRVQREEALRKIKLTETDLTRLNDILAELDKEIRSLRYQMGKAKRFTRLKEKVDLMESALIKKSLYELLEKRDELRRQKSHHQGVTLEDDNEITLLEARLQEFRILVSDQERKLSELHVGRYELSQSLQQHEEKIAVHTERISAGHRRIGENEDEIRRSTDKLRSLSDELETLGETIASKEAESGSLETALAEKADEHEAITRELDAAKKVLRERKQSALDLLRERARERGLREQLELSLGELTGKRDALELSLLELSRQESEIVGRLSHTRKNVEEKKGEVLDLKQSLHRLESKSTRIVELISRCEDRYAKSAIEVNRLKEKKDYLERIRSEHARNSDEVLARNARIKGVLADHVKISKEHRKCFEACLAPFLHSLLVDSKEDALLFLDEVRQSGNGRVQILYRNGDRVPVRRYSGKNVVGAALELVRGDNKIIDYLAPYLSDVVVVKDLEAALAILKEHKDARVATLDGVFLDGPGRIVVAGSEDVELTLLDCESKIAEVTAALEGADRNVHCVGGRRWTLSAIKNRLLEGLVDARTRLSKAEAEIEALSEEQSRVEIELARVREKTAGVSMAAGEHDRAVDGLLARLETVAAAGREDREPSSPDVSFADDEQRVLELERRKEILGEDVGKTKLEAARVAGEIDTLKTKHRHWKTLFEDLNDLIRVRSEDSTRCRDQISASEAEVIGMRGAISGFHAELDGIEKEIEKVNESCAEVKDQEGALEVQLKEVRGRREEKRTMLQRCDLELATVETRIGALVEKARENFSTDLEPCLEDRSRLDSAEWENLNQEELAELRVRLERFGPVNMLAIDEFGSRKERFDFLSKQKQDLEEARESLIQAIRRINREARQRLSETFELVRQNFKKTFLTLFGGGEADLLFVDSDDPLEANIKIVANPKGKRLHDISSLSGGERALVALSLLFAIYLVKPSPFCVFDEVDAPLDDANISRFVNMLKSFSEKTQFIVITHNKRTMEAADYLYGVTMEEPGVSKMISVEIGEADRFKDEPDPRAEPSFNPEPSGEEISV